MEKRFFSDFESFDCYKLLRKKGNQLFIDHELLFIEDFQMSLFIPLIRKEEPRAIVSEV